MTLGDVRLRCDAGCGVAVDYSGMPEIPETLLTWLETTRPVAVCGHPGLCGRQVAVLGSLML